MIELHMTLCLSLPTRSLPTQTNLGFCDSSLYKVWVLSSGCFVRLSFIFILHSSSTQFACNDLKTIHSQCRHSRSLKFQGFNTDTAKSKGLPAQESRTSFNCFRNKLSVQTQNYLPFSTHTNTHGGNTAASRSFSPAPPLEASESSITQHLPGRASPNASLKPGLRNPSNSPPPLQPLHVPPRYQKRCNIFMPPSCTFASFVMVQKGA